MRNDVNCWANDIDLSKGGANSFSKTYRYELITGSVHKNYSLIHITRDITIFLRLIANVLIHPPNIMMRAWPTPPFEKISNSELTFQGP